MHHRWLDGVVVQGEIDVIRRAEREEADRRRVGISRSGSTASVSALASAAPTSGTGEVETTTMTTKKKMSGLTQSEADAMKPVGGVESAANSPSPSRGQDGQHDLHQPPKLGAVQVPVPTTPLGTAPVPIPATIAVAVPVPASAKEKENVTVAAKRRSGGVF
jgi:serine/threonine-protein kinase SRPK3